MTRLIVAALTASLLAVAAASAAPVPPEPTQDVVFFGPTRPMLVRLCIEVDGKPYAKVLETWVADLFTFLDRDKDGVLNADEIARAPKPAAMIQRMQQGGFVNGAYQTLTLAEADENGNKKVSLEELTTYYRGSELGMARMAPTQQSGYSAEAATAALLDQFDLNKDGKLTPEEMKRAGEVLAKLDINDDEVITLAEVLPGVQPNGGQPVRGPAMEGMAGKGGGGSFFLASSRFDLAQQIVARYDVNKDGKLERDEIDLDEETFLRLDVNRNRDLDARELIKLFGKTADVEVILRLGGVANGVAPVEMVPPEKGAPYKSKLVNGGLAVTIAGAQLDLRPASGFLLQGEQIKRTLATQIVKLDSMKRGFVTKEDVAKQPALLAIFDFADADGDGKLTEKEMGTLIDLEARASALVLSLTSNESGRGLFEMIDQNKDGRLSVREMRTACDRMETGTIRKDDLPKQFGLSVAQSPFAGAGNRGGGGVPQPGYNNPTGLRPVGVGPVWFRKMDANGDGDVSKREWLGSPEDFKKLDLDGDGVISPEEAAKAEADTKK